MVLRIFVRSSMLDYEQHEMRRYVRRGGGCVGTIHQQASADLFWPEGTRASSRLSEPALTLQTSGIAGAKRPAGTPEAASWFNGFWRELMYVPLWVLVFAVVLYIRSR